MTRVTLTLAAKLAATAISATACAAAAQTVKPPELGQTVAAKGAPKPARLIDGHPNWTGFWTSPGGLLDVYRGPSGVTPIPGRPAGGTNGVAPPVQYTPLKSPYKEQYAAFVLEAKTGKVADPVALCFPPGMPRMMSAAYGIEILQTPGQVTITSEWQAASRRIWLSRKSHPPTDELDPTYIGDAIGHWEGDTLVVDTVGIRTDVPLNYFGLPHSEKLHLIEHISSPSPGKLVDDVTVDDPDAFEGPWHTRFAFGLRPDLNLKEYVCEENNRNVGASGEALFDHK